MLEKIYVYKIELELLSGMHITGSDNTFDIGGADSQVIKNPLTGEPYIPGSSVKGKLRSLLEYRYGKLDKQNEKYEIIDDNHCLDLFEPSMDTLPMMTRGIFRDFVLTEESKTKLTNALGENIYTEIKAENSIDRFKGTANSPRFIERVPAGAKFNGEIDVLVFEGDQYEDYDEYLKEALKLLELNFIGGSGSRGYGRVLVTVKSVNEEEV